MKKSKYLGRFQALWTGAPELFTLHDNRLLVEILPKDELKSKGGLILTPSRSDHRSVTEENQHQLAVILYVGAGFLNEKNEVVRPNYQPGNLVLVSPYSLKPYTSFPMLAEYTANELALTRDIDVHCSFKNEDEYLKACQILNNPQSES